MKTINIADGLFITYEVNDVLANSRAYECLIHMTGSVNQILGFAAKLDEMDIDEDETTLELYCQEHLDGYHQ